MEQRIKIIAVSGSLRASSSATRVLEALQTRFEAYGSYFLFKGLAAIPPFDDANNTPIEVSVWRQHLQEADAVLICSPEYAFGIPGALKNAIDWTVASGEWVNKPIALITAATSGEKAHAAWLDVFKALSANITPERSVLISHVRAKIDDNGNIIDPAATEAVETLVKELVRAAIPSLPAEN